MPLVGDECSAAKKDIITPHQYVQHDLDSSPKHDAGAVWYNEFGAAQKNTITQYQHVHCYWRT